MSLPHLFSLSHELLIEIFSNLSPFDLYICGSLAGERRVTALIPERAGIAMRAYNPFRVLRALALLGGAGREVMLECWSVVKVVKEPSVHCGGELFRDDIETNLPYVETATPCTADTCESFMDEDNLMVQVRTEVSHVCTSIYVWGLKRLTRLVKKSTYYTLCHSLSMGYPL
jgi:hypothetical protein